MHARGTPQHLPNESVDLKITGVSLDIPIEYYGAYAWKLPLTCSMAMKYSSPS